MEVEDDENNEQEWAWMIFQALSKQANGLTPSALAEDETEGES